MTEPLVSICCLCYNHEPYIRECLDGFMMQKTNFAIEVLIHDDASTDKSADLIREYEAKYPEIIKPIYQTENQYSKGVGVTLTYQFPRAKGKYIAICEGDDFWTDPYKLQKQVDILENNQNLIAVVTNTSVCDKNGNIIENEKLVIPPHNKEGIYNLHDFFINTNRYPTLTVVYRNIEVDFIVKQLHKLSNPYLGDWILWVLLHKLGDFYFLNQVTASYRINPASVTHTVNSYNRWKEDIIIRKKIALLLPAEYSKYLQYDTYAYHNMATSLRKQRFYFKSIFYYIKAFVKSPASYSKFIVKTLKMK